MPLTASPYVDCAAFSFIGHLLSGVGEEAETDRR
jgi:hypothetical protein